MKKPKLTMRGYVNGKYYLFTKKAHGRIQGFMSDWRFAHRRLKKDYRDAIYATMLEQLRDDLKSGEAKEVI
jgi:hypothetical protein